MKSVDGHSTLPDGSPTVGGMFRVTWPRCSFDVGSKEGGQQQGKERFGESNHSQNGIYKNECWRSLKGKGKEIKEERKMGRKGGRTG